TASWLALAGIALLYLVVFRGIRYPLLMVVTLLLGTAWAMGWLTLTVGHLNILSATFAVMLFGMGDYAVLWVMRYEQARQLGLAAGPEPPAEVGHCRRADVARNRAFEHPAVDLRPQPVALATARPRLRAVANDAHRTHGRRQLERAKPGRHARRSPGPQGPLRETPLRRARGRDRLPGTARSGAEARPARGHSAAAQAAAPAWRSHSACTAQTS